VWVCRLSVDVRQQVGGTQPAQRFGRPTPVDLTALLQPPSRTHHRRSSRRSRRPTTSCGRVLPGSDRWWRCQRRASCGRPPRTAASCPSLHHTGGASPPPPHPPPPHPPHLPSEADSSRLPFLGDVQEMQQGVGCGCHWQGHQHASVTLRTSAAASCCCRDTHAYTHTHTHTHTLTAAKRLTGRLGLCLCCKE
jgi:hypothetical protein